MQQKTHILQEFESPPVGLLPVGPLHHVVEGAHQGHPRVLKAGDLLVAGHPEHQANPHGGRVHQKGVHVAEELSRGGGEGVHYQNLPNNNNNNNFIQKKYIKIQSIQFTLANISEALPGSLK